MVRMSIAFLLVIPTEAKVDSTWYSASASELGEKPTSPAVLRTAVPRGLISA
jgi:hypothetical protein